MIFPHIVELQPTAAAHDERGNLVRRPGSFVESAAFIQPRSSTEDDQAVSNRAVVYLPPNAPRLDAFSQIVWAAVIYEAVGAAAEQLTPFGRHHWRIEVRRVGS